MYTQHTAAGDTRACVPSYQGNTSPHFEERKWITLIVAARHTVSWAHSPLLPFEMSTFSRLNLELGSVETYWNKLEPFT